MAKKFKHLIIYFFLTQLSLISIDSVFAIDSISVKYFPLQTGNRFTYYYQYYGNSGSGHYYITGNVLRDSLFNNYKYFFCTGFPNLNNAWVRTDTVTGSLYKYDTTFCSRENHERLVDSLGAFINDTVRTCYNFQSANFICQGIYPDTLFGYISLRKNFSYQDQFGGGGSSATEYFKHNIGLIYYYSSFSTATFQSVSIYSLRGCIVNGVPIGDTSTVLINSISNLIPENFLLSQNYPNPFNPITVIKFEIPSSSNVKLSVFNSLGKEIEILVNEKLQSGSYEITFDGSNYPSGIYFYKLEGDGFIETKRMVLVK